MNSNGTDKGVDTSKFIRGVQPAEGKEQDSDSTGMWEKSPVSFLSLLVSEYGCPLIPYGSIFGGNQGGKGEAEWFTFNFRASIEWEGEVVEDATFQARVEGRKLEHLIHQVRCSKRATIRVSGLLDGDKPSVTAVRIRKLEE